MTQDVSASPARAVINRLARLGAVAVVAAMVLLALRTPQPAQANFHIAAIDEAMFGTTADANVQFVEIKEEVASQNLVSHSRLSAWNADGSFFGVLLEVPGNVPNAAANARWIMGTSAYAAASGMTPDFIFSPVALQSAGMICWGAPGLIPPNPASSWDETVPANYIDCIPYGGYLGPPIKNGPATPLGLGDGTQSLTRTSRHFPSNASLDFSLGCPSPTNNYGGVGFNHDNHIDLPAARLFDDLTWPNSDLVGDNCGDTDDDNDGLSDATETGGPPCASASGPTDPLNRDSDGDGVLDGAECALGTDPASALSKPPNSPPGDTDHDGLTDAFEMSIGTSITLPDTDGDKLNDGVEVKFYNSDPLSTNTDGDVCTDGKEAASVNGDNTVNSTDQLIVSQQFGPKGGPNYVLDFDVNRDSTINSTDMLIQAKVFGACP